MLDNAIRKRGFLAAAGGGIIGLALWNSATPAESAGRFEITKTEAQWRGQLGAQRYYILRQGGTERAGTSALLEEKRRGVYACAGCGSPLFASTTKYDSGTGWPSFFRPLAKAVVTRPDRSLLMTRTEVLCRRCGGHLGHVFEDGPRPTGLRYCMNGLALNFRPVPA
ncbi:MAG TPA: peptide-methionine (R)-S-oxide reductase MsrB [Sphingomicrobium sp.]|nr:peptide-methionine (R)-S-oxide reductase MsrB [Sphingomicrobium sp.]